MSKPFDALGLPPATLEKGGVEILRAGVVEGTLHIAIRRAFDDPQAWGMVIADVARHVARIHAMETGTSETETVERIRGMFDAELDGGTEGEAPRPMG